jgi:hypothetical protein
MDKPHNNSVMRYVTLEGVATAYETRLGLFEEEDGEIEILLYKETKYRKILCIKILMLKQW